MNGSSPGDPADPRDRHGPRGLHDPRDVFVRSVLALVSTPEMTDALNDFVRDVAEALHVDAVGILVRGPSGEPELLCATSHRMAELAIYAVGHEEGPCVECLRSGVGVIETGEAIPARWPSLGPVIGAAFYQSTEEDLVEQLPWFTRVLIHQATGVVVAQLSVPVEDAMALLRANAYASGKDLNTVAEEVLSRELAFDSTHVGGGEST